MIEVLAKAHGCSDFTRATLKHRFTRFQVIDGDCFICAA